MYCIIKKFLDIINKKKQDIGKLFPFLEKQDTFNILLLGLKFLGWSSQLKNTDKGK